MKSITRLPPLVEKGLVTLITGGAYYGKSTLLRALERGVYNDFPGHLGFDLPAANTICHLPGALPGQAGNPLLKRVGALFTANNLAASGAHNL